MAPKGIWGDGVILKSLRTDLMVTIQSVSVAPDYVDGSQRVLVDKTKQERA